jgi:ribosomal protein S18 acetylase RimI-like enzyme
VTEAAEEVRVRNTLPGDFPGISDLCKCIYPDTAPWSANELSSHLAVFPEGQFVAVYGSEEKVVGMCASLIVLWDDYQMLDNWETFTADGFFTNHDAKRGHTLYGAEVIVDPRFEHHGIGEKLYCARRGLTKRLELWRIRGGSRLRGYHQYAGRVAPEEYVVQVVHGYLRDPTLTFQLHQGFHVLAVVPHYLSDDPASLGMPQLSNGSTPKRSCPKCLSKGQRSFCTKTF